MAQFSQSYEFLQAVKKRDGDKATSMLSDPASQMVNTRDSSSGQTALYIVIDRRDSLWLDFLIQKGANVNVRDVRGVSPLMEAVNLGWNEGVATLLNHGARIDDTDDTGATPLINAVHRRDPAMARTLLAKGANPDRPDNSGRSARDYVELDGPSNPVYDVIEAVRKGSVSSSKTYGPSL
ncbi:MAG: ankyrin repeat domain-containing protein [Sphingomonadales bacterium]|nr:ankyrin repeat domain-containing protein [Sphingomonadales bacterium]MDE2570357.1 ankyrin repeat domain-containing protein [Sphingomonadales bacterium]